MRKYKAPILCLMIFLLVMMPGCGKRIYFSTGLSSNELFKIAGSPLTVQEAMLFLTTVKNQYELSFGGEMWDKDLGGFTLEDSVKDSVKNQLAHIKCLNLFAKEHKITLSESEKDKLNKVAG